jgi:hypothetical protein
MMDTAAYCLSTQDLWGYNWGESLQRGDVLMSLCVLRTYCSGVT